MDLASKLFQRLQSLDNSLHLLHLVVQNWIVFQRDSFDIFDDYGDPFTTQIFLIEISTGKYIHRVQGSKVDCGATLDDNLLFSKLTEAFVDSKVCQGFSLKSKSGSQPDSLLIQEFPFKRKVAQNCQYLFEPALKTSALNHEQGFRWVCPVCEEACENGQENGEDADMDSIEVNPLKLEAVLSEEIDLFSFVEVDEHNNDGVGVKEHEQDSTNPIAKKPTIDDDSETVKKKQAKKGYYCNHCSETFKTLWLYQKHQREKRKVGCKECKEDIITFKELVEHVYVTHTEVFEKYFKYGQSMAELEHLSAPKQCNLCDMIYNGKLLLSRHKEVFHELGDFRCDLCRKPCLTFYDLLIHNYQKHDVALEHLQPQTHGLEAVSLPDGKITYKRGSFPCHHCDATYVSDSAWIRHMRANHSWHHYFECKICDEACHYAADFSTHMLTFHADRPEIKCPTIWCSHFSNLKDDPEHFNSHFRECERLRRNNKDFVEQKVLQCHTCGKIYVCKLAFDAHVKRHQGIEHYKCSHCDYGTNHKAVLVNHEKAHLREKGLTNADTGLVLYHSCDQCEKKYSTKRAVLNHVKYFHEGIKKIYPCKDCDQILSSHTSLYNHKRKVHGLANTQDEKRPKQKKKNMKIISTSRLKI